MTLRVALAIGPGRAAMPTMLVIYYMPSTPVTQIYYKPSNPVTQNQSIIEDHITQGTSRLSIDVRSQQQ